MRVLVLSDVHGNVRALEAVLADAGKVDLVVANGDLLAFGPRPRETLALLRSLPRVRFVSGNNDRNLVERRWEQPAADGWEAEAFANLRWTAAAIGQEGLEAVAQWPFCLHLPVRPPVLVVHASPLADSIGMFPWTPDDALGRMVSDVQEAVVVCGHTHLQMDRRIPGRRVISDGSAGFPLDHDVRPSYLVLEDADGDISAEFHRVSYDLEAALQDLQHSPVPFGQVIAYQLRHAALMPKRDTDYAHRELVRIVE